MLEADVRDAADHRINHRRCVESATKTCLEHDDVNSLVSEILDRNSGQNLKVGRLVVLAERLRDLLNRCHDVSELGVRDHLVVDHDALAKVDQMWARVDAI